MNVIKKQVRKLIWPSTFSFWEQLSEHVEADILLSIWSVLDVTVQTELIRAIRGNIRSQVLRTVKSEVS